jgi:hypothetical protein
LVLCPTKNPARTAPADIRIRIRPRIFAITATRSAIRGIVPITTGKQGKSKTLNQFFKNK